MAETIQRTLSEERFIENGHPFLDGSVRRDDGRRSRVALHNQVIEVGWGLAGQLAKTEVVNDNKIGRDEATQFDDRKTFPVVQTKFAEREAQFSPDGKWIAYQSNETGQFEIYIQPFPDAKGKKYGPISTNGGVQVRWSITRNSL